MDEATRFVDGQAYTRKIGWYDNALRPTRVEVTIPEREAELSGPAAVDDRVHSFHAYDAAGNMTSRNVGGSPQQLEWDAAGRTSKVTRHDGRESEYLGLLKGSVAFDVAC
ncbi:hypothetical protein GCM10009676_10850 [Prauserella halophila]|uniref:YD repeat-containing protein n=1 Tax=Prauserella halophila TaxID=185641 RepID=A0ABP4GNE9_9PSEU|nr:RHS repeat domain-containing protein [Prauserella halophila]